MDARAPSIVLVFAVLSGCSAQVPQMKNAAPQTAQRDLAPLESELVKAHGDPHRERIRRGLKQVASLWREDDGDLAAFARESFLSDPALLHSAFARLESALEQFEGHAYEAGRTARWGIDVESGPVLPVDPLLATYDPSAHLAEDLFRVKVGFVALLNWPLATLAEKEASARSWSRDRWAEVRLTGRFAQRVPGEVRQKVADAAARAELFISEFNVWPHHVFDATGRRLLDEDRPLITHWNLRDQLKAAYADGAVGLDKQRAYLKVMEGIITETIPAEVIGNPYVDWDPASNVVKPAPKESVGPRAPPRAPGLRNARYERLLQQYRAATLVDPYSPTAPTAIARSYEISREMPVDRVVALFQEILTSPLVSRVAAEAQRRLGRGLEPHDLWYDGFKPRASIPEAELTKVTRARYATPEAFAKDIPRILQQLGFSRDRARFVAERIRVDPSRGAGHAMQPGRRGDFARLRTRVGPDGMDYLGYNIAVHELGHNVEQVFSLYEVDHTLLSGVPNNAFTEALAFVFQARDLELLGRQTPPDAERLRVLADFWQAWEMSGVALVDLEVWRWMYAHPDSTPEALREATVRIAREHWNRFYAPVLGGRDSPLLAIYSHMISYPLYLADYPIGRMIAFQIEEHLARAKDFGAEFERMARQGALTPDAWMEGATGAPVGAGPLLRATERALAGGK
jgi:hypothetical protein